VNRCKMSGAGFTLWRYLRERDFRGVMTKFNDLIACTEGNYYGAGLLFGYLSMLDESCPAESIRLNYSNQGPFRYDPIGSI
jgi:hypothetical protein